MPITTKDIAKELGLSQSTVSRILSGDAGHRIASGTRQLVLDAARRMEYRPNAIARSLKRGRTNIIGLYTCRDYDARNDFLGAILGGLQHACADLGLDLLLHIGMANSGVDAVYNSLRDGRVDGLLLHTSDGDPLAAKLAASNLPVISIADPLEGLPSVTCDDADGMRQTVHHLWAAGHHRYVFLAPHFSLASVERRREAWEKSLADLGVAESDRTVLRIEGEEAHSALDALMTTPPSRTALAPSNAGSSGRGRKRSVRCAVSAWNDRTAYALLRACRERGIAVPGRIAVTGFDGFLDEKLPAAALTTVSCPWADVAARAANLLVRRINGEPIDHETRLPVTLSAGDTA